eukprot:9213168-Pyramimonas_sp.AAC.1
MPLRWDRQARAVQKREGPGDQGDKRSHKQVDRRGWGAASPAYQAVWWSRAGTMCTATAPAMLRAPVRA